MANDVAAINHPLEAVSEGDLLAAVRETGQLADVSISVWGGSQTDNRLLGELKSKHGATGDVGRVIKNLLAGADAKLKATRSAFLAVRLRHYALTLPWVNDPHASRQEGARFLPHLLFQRYLAEINTLKRAAMQQLDEFLDDYPDLVEDAKANLGSMADGARYPTVDELRHAFRVHVDFTPIPESSRFRGLDDHTLERLGKRLENKQARQIAEAQREIWKRAEKPVRNLIERLSADSFRESTLDNVRDLLVLLPGWNLTSDPEVKAITDELRDLTDGMDSKELRGNPDSREHLIRKARAVADKLAKKAQA